VTCDVRSPTYPDVRDAQPSWGRARASLMQRVSTARFDNASFPFATSQEIDVRLCTVRATAAHTYVGELGWSFTSRWSSRSGRLRRVARAGRDLGLIKWPGDYAIDSLRLEKGYRAWAATDA